MKQLIGVIPAAGLGTRLFPYNSAKELLPVGTQRIRVNGKYEQRPKIVSQYIIEAMVEAGVERIIVIVNPNKQSLIDLHQDGKKYGVDISYIVQSPPSMAHSVDLAYEQIKSSTVVMGMPDTVVLPRNCIRQLVRNHTKNPADLSLGLFPTKKPSKFGMVKIDRKSNLIYHKDKPKRTDAKLMWGLAIWEPTFTEALRKQALKTKSKKKELTLGDIFDTMISAGKTCKGYSILGGKYYDIGTYDDYKRAIIEL